MFGVIVDDKCVGRGCFNDIDVDALAAVEGFDALTSESIQTQEKEKEDALIYDNDGEAKRFLFDVECVSM